MLIPENLLIGKKVLLGVSGSIAVYKALELTRLFIKAGAEVKVVMTPSAQKFVAPLSFETLSRNLVLTEDSESWSNDNNHIKVGHWADMMVIAPCTVNTIGKLSNAIADNLLLQAAIAFDGPKILAPSANTNMINNPIAQGALKMLKVSGYDIVDTQTKDLACQTTGDGAMAEPEDIFFASARSLLKEPFWDSRMVIVTGGGTIEKIDDVRYLSNFSSGKMASALATALFLKGADVNLIATRKDADLPSHIHTIDVESASEMQEYLVDSIRIAKKGKMSKPSLMHGDALELIQKTPYLFMAAAVSDYLPAFEQQGKLKKEMLGDSWAIELKQNNDILSTIDKTGIKTIAFKAEMDEATALHNAGSLIDKKSVDAVCLNLLKDSSSFGTEDNQIEFITPSGVTSLPKSDKLTLSLAVITKAQAL